MKMKILLFLIVFVLILISLMDWFGVTTSQLVRLQSCQPVDVKYNDQSYCVKVIQLNQILNSKLIILISNKDIDTSYGHVLSFPNQNIISQEELDKLQVEWKPNGLEIKTFWDVVIFVPAKNFTQSR